MWCLGVPVLESSFLVLFFFKCFIFIFETERWGVGRKKRDRERLPSGLCTDSREPDVGLEPTNCEIMA